MHVAPVTLLPSARPSSPTLKMAEQAPVEQAINELTALVRELSGRGVAKAELEAAFGAALATAYAPPATSVPPPKIVGELRPPKTASDAQAAFREAYPGRFVSSETQKFLSAVIGDRAAAFTFRYERVYAVGFAALCDIGVVAGFNHIK